MPRPLPSGVHDLVSAQHGVITRAQLLHLGVSDRVVARLVREGALVRLHPGAFVDARYWAPADQGVRHCMRLFATQLQTPDAAAYAQSAAAVWALPLRRLPARPMLILDGDAPRPAHAVVRRSGFLRAHVTDRAGLRVTTLPKTVIDVAAETQLADALITVDAALRRGVRLPHLMATCDVAPPVRRLAAVLDALDAGDPYSESWLESLSRGRMIERGMPVPLCNVVLRASARWVRVDFLLGEQGVIGEADGVGKYLKADEPGQTIVRERDRQHWLEDLGFEVARWGAPEVAGDGAAMAARLDRAIARQTARGFTWPSGVQAEVPLLGSVQPPARVVREVLRLAPSGVPIVFTDAFGQPVDVHLPAA